MKTTLRTMFSLACLLGLSIPAHAHVDVSHSMSTFALGFTHPFSGFDHLFAMLAVGLWAVQSRRSTLKVYLLPALFPLVMVLGASLGWAGVSMPASELLIAASVLVLGALIACAAPTNSVVGACLVAIFALAHGYAHGIEAPQGGISLSFGFGFVCATVLLHLAGMMLGFAAEKLNLRGGLRVIGTGIGAVGLMFLASLT
ncbi:MAG: HupE/UreJ family protein [Burkholderiaceae bacterium]|nr:HupE/UreJ family protein [Burkholderiaceae bacterium]